MRAHRDPIRGQLPPSVQFPLPTRHNGFTKQLIKRAHIWPNKGLLVTFSWRLFWRWPTEAGMRMNGHYCPGRITGRAECYRFSSATQKTHNSKEAIQRPPKTFQGGNWLHWHRDCFPVLKNVLFAVIRWQFTADTRESHCTVVDVFISSRCLGSTARDIRCILVPFSGAMFQLFHLCGV